MRLLIAVAAALLLAGCSSTAVNTSSVDTSTVPNPVAQASSVVAAASSSEAAAQPAHVGDTIELDGDSGKMDVTLVKVEDVKATDQFSTPTAGNRYVGVLLRIKNLGTAAYSDAIDNDVTVQDAQSQSYQTTIVESINAGPTFPTPLHIAAGGTAQGWVVLEVPVGTAVAGAQFSLSSGTGNGAQWIVP